MADSTSDSGSVQSLQVEQGADKKPDASTRFYALYFFYPHRLQVTDSTAPSELKNEGDGSLSLSVVATNLAAATETDLRKTIAHRLSKNNACKKGEGIFLPMGLIANAEISSSASCYFCILEATSDSLGFDLVSVDDKIDLLSDRDRQQFVVCFISFRDSCLDLFRTELDQYSQGLTPLLDKEPLVSSLPLPGSSDTSNNAILASDTSAQRKELSQLSTKIRTYLEQWPSNVLEYLKRTLQYMGPNIQQLIYASLLNASLQISGANTEQEDDVKRFFQCCSLSPLLERLQPENTSVSGSSDSTELWQLQPVIISLTFLPDGKGVTFDKTYTCQYCKHAADKLMSLDPACVTKVRDLLESVKMTFVHILNKLKRFLKEAEVDHYALYRALSYLKKCGCEDLLMRYVKLDGGPETLNVLTVIETCIRDIKQTTTT